MISSRTDLGPRLPPSLGDRPHPSVRAGGAWLAAPSGAEFDAADVDDVIQEAYSRLYGADLGEIASGRSYLCVRRRRRRSNALISELNSPKYDVVNAVLRLDLGWGSLVNSFGYLNAQNDTTTDLSSVYVPLLPLLGFPAGFITSGGLGSTSNIDVYTDEIRLASNPGGVLDWTVGLYGRQLDRDGISRTTTAPGSAPFDLISASATSESTAWAAFGELAWHATDRLTLIGGLRYYDEKRTLTATAASFGLPASNANEGTFELQALAGCDGCFG